MANFQWTPHVYDFRESRRRICARNIFRYYYYNKMPGLVPFLPSFCSCPSLISPTLWVLNKKRNDCMSWTIKVFPEALSWIFFNPSCEVLVFYSSHLSDCPYFEWLLLRVEMRMGKADIFRTREKKWIYWPSTNSNKSHFQDLNHVWTVLAEGKLCSVENNIFDV